MNRWGTNLPGGSNKQLITEEQERSWWTQPNPSSYSCQEPGHQRFLEIKRENTRNKFHPVLGRTCERMATVASKGKEEEGTDLDCIPLPCKNRGLLGKLRTPCLSSSGALRKR